MATPSKVLRRKAARPAGRTPGRSRAASKTRGATDGASVVGLSDREIVRAAREIIAEVGVDGLTMRLLSTRLGVALGATYHHVPTKHDLLVLVGNNLYSEVRFPPPEEGGWDRRLRVAMVNLADLVSAYPGMSTYMQTHVDDMVPTKLNQAMIEILAHEGFGPRNIAALMTALLFYVSGMASGAVSAKSSRTFRGVDVQELFEDGLDLMLAGARDRLAEDKRRGASRSP